MSSPTDRKLCTKCLTFKPLSGFGPNKRGRSGLRSWCRACFAQAGLESKLRNPERMARRRRDNSLKDKFGISRQEWDALFTSQGNCCGICGRTDTGTKRDWHTDHDHITGKVRGILCHGCNMALCGAKDNPETLIKAAQYLKEHSDEIKRD